MAVKIVEDMPFRDYVTQSHSDVPLLSKTVAKTIIEKSPRIAQYFHPKLGGNQKPQTQAMKDGSIIHAMLLDGSDEVRVLDYKDWRTDEAKSSRQEIEDGGRIAVLRKDVAQYTDMIKEARSHVLESFPVYFNDDVEAKKELSIFYEFGNGVQCQSRYDWISRKYGIIVDWKTTTDASPEKCEKDIVNFGYDIQEAMYTDAAKQLDPGIDWRFVFIFAEKKPPYAVSVIETDPASKEVGNIKAYTASEVWRTCLENDTFPGYGYNVVSVPNWELRKYAE